MMSFQTRKTNQKISSKLKQRYRQYYMWIIKHLIMPTNKIITRGLDIYISDILFFKKGQPKQLFSTKQVYDPSIKSLTQQKIFNPMIVKTFSQKRKKYRDHINTVLGKKNKMAEQKKKFSFTFHNKIKRQIKFAAIIKYSDGCESAITENQFLNLMQRRKQDPIWKEICFIKNFKEIQTNHCTTVVTKYAHNDIKYQQLFKRAKTLTRVYGQNILPSEDTYITDQQQLTFSKSLQKQSLQIFGYYLIYKIVNYIQYFHDSKINNIIAKFIINQIGQTFLQEVYKLQTQQLFKYQWTQQIYLKKIQQQQNKLFPSQNTQQPVVPTINTVSTNNIIQIQNTMDTVFTKLKQQYGFIIELQDHSQQTANNQFFKTLYPSLPKPLSQILNEKHLSVQQIKQIYLGYRPTKKPIIRPHTSNMINRIHQLTPQFSRAQNHFKKTRGFSKQSISTTFTSKGPSKHSISTNFTSKVRHFSYHKTAPVFGNSKSMTSTVLTNRK